MLQVDDKVLADIDRGFQIPARPDMLVKLQKLMSEPEPSLESVAEVISHDLSISATILKTVNSPIYGLARSIADIHRAVNYIGLGGIYNLVTGCLLKNGFAQQQCHLNLEAFWQNSNNIASASVHIAKHLNQRIAPETLFTLGLFHDCGMPVLAMKYRNYQQALDTAIDNPSYPLPAIEERLYQVNHATIGYYVASNWHLPKDICQLILRHHDRDFLNELDNSKQQLAFAILKMAENLAYQHKHFRDAPDWAYLQEAVFSVLTIDEGDYQDIYEDLTELLE